MSSTPVQRTPSYEATQSHDAAHTNDINHSAQHGVETNPDPVLLSSHEHTHPHLHHSAMAERGRTDELVYSTDDKPTIPLQTSSPASGDIVKEKYDANVVDAEAGATSVGSDGHNSHRMARAYGKFKPIVHLFIFLLFTGWWIAGLILHRSDFGWVVPFLVWLCITLRLVFFYVPITIITKPMHWVWTNTGVRAKHMIPEKIRTPAAALLVLGVILAGALGSEETKDNTRANRAVSLFGLVVLLAGLWATSKHRSKIMWHTVIVGMLMQFIIALFVLRTGVGYDIFKFISDRAGNLLSFASDGTSFLTSADVVATNYFLVLVIPAIVFFVGLVQLLYYFGFIQWFIGKFAVFFFWSMKVSGAEAVVASASPFIGQGESAMLIKPFVPHLTKAEIHQVMTSGFATISGSVLVAYIGLGINPQALVSSCVMSIPASLAISKMRHPETEETLTAGRVVVPDSDEHEASNALHAFANGAWMGIKIAGMIVATLLCILALLGLVDALLSWWGKYLNIIDPPLTIELLVGYICYPIAFLLGVPRNGDLYKVAQVIGIKLVANEFVAYTDLQTEEYYSDLSDRSRLIATYALCGFANIGSLGTQIGVLSQIAPSRGGDVASLALSALISGALSTFSSAGIAGMLVTDQQAAYLGGTTS